MRLLYPTIVSRKEKLEVPIPSYIVEGKPEKIVVSMQPFKVKIVKKRGRPKKKK